jgi:hypothetical protein
MTLVIQTPLKLMIYNFTSAFETRTSEIVTLIDQIDDNPFEFEVSYFGSTIMVLPYNEERKIVKHENDYDVYI